MSKWEQGNRQAWADMLRECLKHLGIDGETHARERLIVEREEVAAQLRQVCALIGVEGDAWDEDTHLGDVIEKHVARPLHYLLEWTAVTDEMPTEEQYPVLGYDAFYGRVGVVENDRRMVFLDGSRDCLITHWRALPASPGQEEGDRVAELIPSL